MTSDHLISAPRCFAEVLVPVFNCLLQHGYMPPVFREAVIIPILKGGNTDLSQSSTTEVLSYVRVSASFWSIVFWKILEAVSSPLTFSLVSNQGCLPQCALVC